MYNPCFRIRCPVKGTKLIHRLPTRNRPVIIWKGESIQTGGYREISRVVLFPCIQVSIHWPLETNYKLKYVAGDQFALQCMYWQINEKDTSELIWLAGDSYHVEYSLWLLWTHIDTEKKDDLADSSVFIFTLLENPSSPTKPGCFWHKGKGTKKILSKSYLTRDWQ